MYHCTMPLNCATEKKNELVRKAGLHTLPVIHAFSRYQFHTENKKYVDNICILLEKDRYAF